MTNALTPNQQSQVFADLTGQKPLWSRSGIVMQALALHNFQKSIEQTAGDTFFEGLIWLQDKGTRGDSADGGRLDAVRTSAPVLKRGENYELTRNAHLDPDNRFEPLPVERRPQFEETDNNTVSRPQPYTPNNQPWRQKNTVTIAGAEVPGNASGVLLRHMEEESHELSVFHSWMNMLHSVHRGKPGGDTLIADTDQNGDIDPAFIANLRSALKVELNENNKTAAAFVFERLDQGLGRGLFSEGQTLGYINDVIITGPPGDRHNYGRNREGKTVNQGHFNLLANCIKGFGDGPFNARLDPYEKDKSEGPHWKTLMRFDGGFWSFQTRVPIASGEEDEIRWRIPPNFSGLSQGFGPAGNGPGGEIDCPPKGGRQSGGQGAGGLNGGLIFPQPFPGAPGTPGGPPADVDIEPGFDESSGNEASQIDIDGDIEISEGEKEPCPKPLRFGRLRGAINGPVVDKPQKKNLTDGHLLYMETMAQAMSFFGRPKNVDTRYSANPSGDDLKELNKAPRVLNIEAFAGCVNNRPNSNSTAQTTRYRSGEAAGGIVVMPPTHDMDRRNDPPSAPDKLPAIMLWDSMLGWGNFGEDGCPQNAMTIKMDKELGLIIQYWNDSGVATDVATIGTDGTITAEAFVS
jgi:hypothetical protein